MATERKVVDLINALAQWPGDHPVRVDGDVFVQLDQGEVVAIPADDKPGASDA